MYENFNFNIKIFYFLLHSSLGPAFKASGQHSKPQASILLEVDLSVLPDTNCYYTIYNVGTFYN